MEKWIIARRNKHLIEEYLVNDKPAIWNYNRAKAASYSRERALQASDWLYSIGKNHYLFRL